MTKEPAMAAAKPKDTAHTPGQFDIWVLVMIEALTFSSYFVVYALDAALALKPNLTRAELLEAIKGHVLAQGEIVPIYERKAP